jgi:myo-inositol-1(or 4)-monophosphatase
VDLPTAGAARVVTPRLLIDPAFLGRFDPRVISSTLAVVWVASGRRVACVIDTDVLGSVHFAAGIAMCRAAGCMVTDLRAGRRRGAGAARGCRRGDAHCAAADARPAFSAV